MKNNNPLILAINPGSTSTKVAIYKGSRLVAKNDISHNAEFLKKHHSMLSQSDDRYNLIMKWVNANINIKELGAVVGRGGLLKPLRGGVYKIDKDMLFDLTTMKYGDHASNLGAILSFKIAKALKLPSFIVDPVTVDELMPEARITGLRGMKRISVFHALNQKAVAKRFAAKYKLKYEKLNLIVVHLGGGISVGAHRKGKVIDVNNPLEEGPFSPERSGSLPGAQLVKLCYSGKYTEKEVLKMLAGKGGLFSHFGTNNCRDVEKMIKKGNKKAEVIYHAMALTVAKHIGSAAAVLNGDVKAVLLTGGLANSRMLIGLIKPRVKFIAPVHIYPGEDEMSALAAGTLRALNGEERVLSYSI